MARAALAAKDDTLALNVVVQQLCIGHGSHRLGLETPNSVRLYGQRMVNSVMAQVKHPPGPPMDLANMQRQGVRPIAE